MTSLIVLEEQLPVITPDHVLPGSPVLHNRAALYVVDEGFADYQSEVHVLMNHCEYNQSEVDYMYGLLMNHCEYNQSEVDYMYGLLMNHCEYNQSEVDYMYGLLMNHCEYNQSEIHVRAAEKPLCEYYQLLTSHWNYDVV